MGNNEENMMSVLKTVFGYDDFKNDVQKNAAIAISRGSKYVCISMPPGFDRSLCFQLPALMRKDKVAVVFSPKLSSIKTDVDFLRSKQINVGLLHKNVHITERNNILNDLTSDFPTITLLYATADMDTVTYFKRLVRSLKEREMLYYIVFNEAHSLSKWGYEYTPCYGKINICNKIYKYVPRVAVTTTVTDKVIEDICKLLILETPNVYKLPVQKLNVHYDVWFLDILSHPFDHLKCFIIEVLGVLDSSTRKIPRGFAIVYCREIITATLLKDKLDTLGIPTLTYHHKLNNSTQRNTEKKWISGEAYVIITTYDYGFIHNKSIRCIVHWTVPENISKYYRECAQIHLDNGHAYCRIYFSSKEYTSVKLVIENHRVMNDIEHIKKRLDEYHKIVSYCLTVKCRHAIISKYFGRVVPSCETNCDACMNEETVGIRTHKFIMYSESVKGIKYNTCDVNEHPKEEQTEPSVTEQTENTVEEERKESNTSCEEVILDSDNDKQYVEKSNDKLVKIERKRSCVESSSLKLQSAKNRNEITMKDAVKCAKDNSCTVRASRLSTITSIVNTYNLNTKEISLEPCSSKDNIPKSTKLKRTISTRTFNDKNKRRNESSNKIVWNNNEIKVDKREDCVSKRDARGAVVIGTKQANKKPTKRFIATDTWPEEFKSKRRKLEPENKPTTGTGINRDREGNAADTCAKRKDDTNEDTMRDHETIEYLMNKYRLNKYSITLEVRKK